MAAQLAEALTRASDAAVLLERGDAAEACALYRKAVKLTAKAVRSDAALAEAAALMADALLAKLAAAKGAEPSAAPAQRRQRLALRPARRSAPRRGRSRPTAWWSCGGARTPATCGASAHTPNASGARRRPARGAFVPRGASAAGSVDVKLDACGHGAFDAAAADLARFARRDDRWLWPLARRVLGDDVVLAYVGLVASFPGSDDQPWHADGVKLFPGHGGELPAHALNCFVPLAALDAELRRGGAPRDVFAPELAPGDLLVYDQRTVHRGVANVSQHSRPILYLLFCRPWFREHINFGSTSLFDDDDEPPREKKKHRS
ncbi:phytanoyl-CoA dioxygenase [Aureococcus anophagefferens]|nr:phytanoyl-CoA dioxygenase [Aureococcus anophagefferens]